MSRELLPANVDASLFRRTAERTKVLNFNYVIPRGGIRL